LAGSGAESLQGYGDFLLKDGQGLARLTVAKVEAHHIAKLPRVESIPYLDLPHLDSVNNGPTPKNIPDELEPEQVGLALFDPMGINKLSKALSIGNNKATRVKQFADGIRQWALENGYNCLSS